MVNYIVLVDISFVLCCLFSHYFQVENLGITHQLTYNIFEVFSTSI